jgi:plastocyanin
VSIGVAGNRWSPANVFLAPGGTVQWTWSGTPQPHEVTVEYSGASSDLATSGAFSSAFPQAPGTYAFRCAVHSDMTGTVTIR